MNYYDLNNMNLTDFWNMLTPAEDLGSQTLASGTRLVGHVPHVAPEAFLHVVFAPVDDEMLLQAEAKLERSIPTCYRDFLQVMNGVWLFNCAVSLDGVRINFARTGEDSRQPFSLLTPNTIERPRNAPPKWFFIGGYDCDQSYVVVEEGCEHVSRRLRDGSLTHQWPSICSFLNEEAKRLSSLFDSQGRLLDPNVPTTPE